MAVSEQEMIAAIDLLYNREQLVAEPAGAAATAAFLKYPPAARTSVVLVTGGNIAPESHAEAGGNGGSTEDTD